MNNRFALRLALSSVAVLSLTSVPHAAVALPYTDPIERSQGDITKRGPVQAAKLDPVQPTTNSSKTNGLDSGKPLSDAPENDALPPALRAQPEPQDKPTAKSDFMSEDRQGGKLGNHFFVPIRNPNSPDSNSDFQPRSHRNFRNFRQTQNSMPGEWSSGAHTPKVQTWNTGSKSTTSTSSKNNQGETAVKNGHAQGGYGKPEINNSAE